MIFLIVDLDEFDFFSKMIADNSPVGYVILDLNYNIVYCNKYITEVMGFTVEELIGRKCYDLVNSGTPCKQCAVRKAYKSLKGEIVTKFETDKFGKFKYNELKAIPVFDKQSNLKYMMEILIDKTEEVMLRRKSEEAFMMLVDTMSHLLEARDDYTGFHSANVKHYSIQVGDFLQLDEKEKKNVFISANLHDIGKVGIRDDIILKEGKLTDTEYQIIKNHPVIGADILAKIKHFDEIADIVKYHHERVDGKGYPDGLVGEEIPFISKIICIADAFDAMTTDRPYRKGLGVDVAIAQIQKHAGTQFDSELSEVFIHLLKNNVIKPLKR